MRRRLAAMAAAAVALATTLLGTAGPAEPASLVAAAWWSAANQGPLVAPPPPDVADGDLLVQGMAAGTEVSGQGPLHHAVAAVRFSLAEDEVPAALVLDMGATSTPQPAVLACPIAGAFRPVENGPWAEVPRHDCQRGVAATVSGQALVFPGVEALVEDGELSLLLVPTGVVRVVLAAPTDASLGVLAPDNPPTPDGGAPAPTGTGAPGAVPAPLADPVPLPPLAPAPATGPGPPGPPAAAGPAPFGDVTDPAGFDFGGDDLGDRLLVAAVLFAVLAPLALRDRSRRGLGARRPAPAPVDPA